MKWGLSKCELDRALIVKFNQKNLTQTGPDCIDRKIGNRPAAPLVLSANIYWPKLGTSMKADKIARDKMKCMLSELREYICICDHSIKTRKRGGVSHAQNLLYFKLYD